MAKFETVVVASLDASDSDSDCDSDSDSAGSRADVDGPDEAARVAASVAEEHKHLGNTAVARCVPLLRKTKSHTTKRPHRRGHFATADGHYTTALRYWPTAQVLCNRAAARLAVGECAAALRDCLAALHLDPGHVKAHVRAARACKAREQAVLFSLVTR